MYLNKTGGCHPKKAPENRKTCRLEKEREEMQTWILKGTQGSSKRNPCVGLYVRTHSPALPLKGSKVLCLARETNKEAYSDLQYPTVPNTLSVYS